MTNFIEKAKNHAMNRRSFLGLTATVAAGAAALTLPGCGLAKVDSTTAAAKLANKEGEWIPAACWHNCGGRCSNKAYVVDGVVIRQKTDDTHPDSPDYPQQRGCNRGRSQRMQVFGVDRLKYPMKRKNWEPGGGKKELRGKDEWVRISWDEALDIVASEIKRIQAKYTNRGIFASNAGDLGRVLSLAGGYIGSWGTSSWGSWRWGPEKFGMAEGFYVQSINDRMDLRNSQLIVIVGGNAAWSAPGNPTYHYLQAKKAGAKFVVIDPSFSDTVEILDADWVPIHPGTDHAMFLGMAYALLTEDNPSTNPLIHWDFLNKYTVGFDKDHMPAGADPKDNFKDYVLGVSDNIPKTPEWAEKISGVSAAKIRELAVQIAKTERVALLTAWGAARIQNSDSWPQMFMTFGAMTGNMGKSGCMTGVSCHYATANGGPSLVTPGPAGLPAIANPIKETINDIEMWKAILEGKYTAGYQNVKDVNIQMIYHGYEAHLQTRSAQAMGIEAHRKVEFVLSVSHFLTTNSKYSDVVLPIITEWEKVGGFGSFINRESLVFWRQVTNPLYEAKSEMWIAQELAKRLGLDASKILPIDEKQQFYNQIAGCKVVGADGKTMEPLVTLTEADIKEIGATGKSQQGRITYQELKQKGVYQVERKPGDNLGFIAYEDFVKDPAAHPLTTASGKLEIHCQALADFVKSKGFTEIKPIPTYNSAVEGYEATFKDFSAQVKGDYPLQVINPHYLRRSHSILNNIPWLREAWPNPVFISAKDAEERGIKEGETVLIKSSHGKTLRPAHVTECLTPGVVALPHGAWVEMDEQNQVDKAGSDNMLTGPIPTGQGIGGWNSTLCQVEKWTGEPLVEDSKWPLRIVF